MRKRTTLKRGAHNMEIGLVGDYIAGLGLDAAKQHMESKIDEHKLKCALKEYIEREKKYNEICKMAEECDFQGLVEYITQELLDDVENRLFAVSANDRKKAHEGIISKAVTYSKASTTESKKRVSCLIAISLEIVSQVFKKRIAASDYLLAAEIVDAVNEKIVPAVESSTSAIQHTVLENKKELSNQLNMVKQSIANGYLYSVENMSQMAAIGQYSQLEKNLRKLLAGMSVEHPLYPDYGFTFDGDILKSTPFSALAQQKYPARLNFKGTIRAGSHYFDDASVDPMDYAYRYQLKLVMSIDEAVKLLGDRPDPIQTEAKQYVGKEIIMIPPEFPEAFPCSIKVGEKTYFDYILLRTEEILNDGTYVIGNKEQTNSTIYFGIKVNPQNPQKEDFKVNIANANNHELLNYAKFMDELARIKDLHIYALNAKKDFIAGIINSVNYETGFESISEEIDFLRRICAIEDYFHIKLNLSGDINEEEYRCVFRISELIFNNEVDLTWKEASFTGVLGEELRKQLENLNTPVAMLSYVGVCDVNIFGAKFKFKYMRTYRCAVMQELDRIKCLVSCLEDGDPIKIKFAPGEDNSAFDTLHIPKKIEQDA